MTNTPQDVSIPVIDFGPFYSSRSEGAATVGKAIYEAFRDFGFAYISNHCIPEETVKEAFTWV
jgi:isopenicillin N synthase-like dioxygenase